MRALLIASVLVTGCWSSTTATGRWVTDVAAARGGLRVVDCDVSHTVSDSLLQSAPTEVLGVSACSASSLALPATELRGVTR